MRALLLALSFVVAATAPSWAAGDRKIQDFFGRYLGQGTVLRVDPGAPLHEPAQKRMSEVIIGPARGEEGFIITWSTLRAKGRGEAGVREADVKTYHQTFRPTQEPNVFNDITSGDPLKGQSTSWARIVGNTLSIFQLQQDPMGGYFLTQYDRTLTPRGMDVHFTRIENSKLVRAVELKLLKGEMPMREGEDRGQGKDWGKDRAKDH